MAMGTAAMTTSLDGFHATATAQRADELVDIDRAKAATAGSPA
jgi:hypothetical protein